MRSKTFSLYYFAANLSIIDDTMYFTIFHQNLSIL